MAELTDAIQLYPWPITQYTNADPIAIPDQAAQAIINGVFVGTRETPGGVKTRPGIKFQNPDNSIGTSTASVIYQTDYWSNIGSEKQARFVVVTSDRQVWVDNYGANWDLEITGSAVTLDSFQEGEVTSAVMNEDLLLGFKDSTTSIAVWEQQSTSTFLVPLSSTTGFSAVASGTFFAGVDRCWIMGMHQNRMFYAGDEQLKDRLYYSKAGQYNGLTVTGTNAAGNIDIFPGDGDSEGITAIFPSLNAQELYVAKRTKLYKVITSDLDPDNWPVVNVSQSVGCVGPNAVRTIDQRDVYFRSDLGWHSLFQVISQTGSIEGTLLSRTITSELRDSLRGADRKAESAAYVTDRNWFLFTTKTTNSTTFDRIYIFDVETGGWGYWQTSADVDLNFISTRLDPTTGKYKIYCGSKNGKVLEFDPDLKTDLDTNSIPLSITSSQIFPQQSFLKETAFTDAYVLARVSSETSLTMSYRIGNGQLITENADLLASGGNVLGTTSLGSNSFFLGIAKGIRPAHFPLYGVDFSGEFIITHDDLGKTMEIYGLVIKFQDSEETRTNQGIGS